MPTSKTPAKRVQVTLRHGVTHTHAGVGYQVAKDGKSHLVDGERKTGPCTIEVAETIIPWMRAQQIIEEA